MPRQIIQNYNPLSRHNDNGTNYTVVYCKIKYLMTYENKKIIDGSATKLKYRFVC
jgi:hypothetical protein